MNIENWDCFYQNEVDSTNTWALNWAENASSGQKALFLADAQTLGRGRRGRSWISLSGNLFFSLCFETEPADISAFTFISSLSLAEAVLEYPESQNISVALKWPNDVLLNGAKVSGILIEKGAKNFLIVGIGVNIIEAPQASNILYPVISLEKAGIKTDKLFFLKKFLAHWNKNITLLKVNGITDILQKWLKLAYKLGENISISQRENVESGKFIGLDDKGALLLQKDDGVVEKKLVGDVFFDKD